MAQDLTDTQWAYIEPLLPELPRRVDGRGCPWQDSREVLNGILWILRTGAQWSEMPDRYPPYQTYRRPSPISTMAQSRCHGPTAGGVGTGFGTARQNQPERMFH